MICPRCQEILFLTDTAEISFSRCSSCSGVFLAPETVRSVTSSPERARIVQQSLEESPPAGRFPLMYIKCPQCLQLMNRLNFGRSSGILVNICLDHGTWFDSGGLEGALEFVAQGKLDEMLAEERREIEEELKSFSPRDLEI